MVSTNLNSLNNPTTVLIIGCGDIGLRLAGRLHAKNSAYQISGLRRSVGQMPDYIKPVIADVTKPETFSRLAQQSYDYIFITLTPAAFTEQAYEQIYVQGLKNALEYFTATKQWFWVSSTSVYGQDQAEWLDENSETLPKSFSGKTLLAAEQLIANSVANFTVVRFTGIYGPGRNRLLNKVRSGEVMHNKRYTNRIHVEDCAAMLAFLLEKHQQGEKIDQLYIGVDHAPCTMDEVYQYLANLLKINLVYSDEDQSQAGANKRCSNQRIVDLGYQFLFPTYREGYAALIDQELT